MGSDGDVSKVQSWTPTGSRRCCDGLQRQSPPHSGGDVGISCYLWKLQEFIYPQLWASRWPCGRQLKPQWLRTIHEKGPPTWQRAVNLLLWKAPNYTCFQIGCEWVISSRRQLTDTKPSALFPNSCFELRLGLDLRMHHNDSLACIDCLLPARHRSKNFICMFSCPPKWTYYPFLQMRCRSSSDFLNVI